MNALVSEESVASASLTEFLRVLNLSTFNLTDHASMENPFKNMKFQYSNKERMFYSRFQKLI